MKPPSANNTNSNQFAWKNDEQSPQPKLTYVWSILTIVAILFVIFIIYKSLHDHKKTHNSNLPVVTAIAKTSDVPVYLSALGTVTSIDSITVKTEVNGTLQSVNYKEGQFVKAGDLLAEIDPRPFQAQVLQFQGQLERDSAQLANARIDLKRFQNLYKLNSVSQQTLDTQEALVKQLDGTVKLDQGQLNGAEINLGYCKITSPIDGRVGLRLVDPGNLVQTSDTSGIVVVNTVNPITVVFTIPEDNVTQVLEQINNGKTLEVQAFDRTQTYLLDTGKLLTIDNQIDPTTGTVKLKAQFDNHHNLLFPNEFVNVKLQVDTLHNAVLVPTAAVQQGTQGPYIFVLNPDQTVSTKSVTTSVVTSNDTVISTGLSSGQNVIVEGTDKLTDGAKVTVENNGSVTQNNTISTKEHHRRTKT